MTSAAVILAAGGGSRFAGSAHKLLTPFRGRPLVAWAVSAALGAGLDETIVVSGAIDLVGVVSDEVTIIDNPRWAEGISGSLRGAVAWAERQGHEAVVVGLGDQPLIPVEAWRAVAAARGCPILVATYGGQRRNPVRLDRSVWAMLPVSGDDGARALMRRRPDLVGEVACEGEPADVDTVEDLKRWS